MTSSLDLLSEARRHLGAGRVDLAEPLCHHIVRTDPAHADAWCLLGLALEQPWYPTARLFRQRTPGDWAPVVERVHQALVGQDAPSGAGPGNAICPSRPSSSSSARLRSRPPA